MFDEQDVIKAALVSMPSASNLNPVTRIVKFQYKVAGFKRSLEPQTGESKPVRFTGAPKETIDFTADLDASDYLAEGNDQALELGIYPQLATLELMVYPGAAGVVADRLGMAFGKMEVIEPEVPLTLFVWGKHRVLPVRLKPLSIVEQYYSSECIPIRAQVNISLEVRSYSDASSSFSPTALLFGAHHIRKEALSLQKREGNKPGSSAGNLLSSVSEVVKRVLEP